jgi:hypothetical protein
VLREQSGYNGHCIEYKAQGGYFIGSQDPVQQALMVRATTPIPPRPIPPLSPAATEVREGWTLAYTGADGKKRSRGEYVSQEACMAAMPALGASEGHCIAVRGASLHFVSPNDDPVLYADPGPDGKPIPSHKTTKTDPNDQR